MKDEKGIDRAKERHGKKIWNIVEEYQKCIGEEIQLQMDGEIPNPHVAYDRDGNAVQLRTYADHLDKQMSILLDLIPREIVDAFPLPLSNKNQQDGGSKSKKHDQ